MTDLKQKEDTSIEGQFSRLTAIAWDTVEKKLPHFDQEVLTELLKYVDRTVHNTVTKNDNDTVEIYGEILYKMYIRDMIIKAVPVLQFLKSGGEHDQKKLLQQLEQIEIARKKDSLEAEIDALKGSGDRNTIQSLKAKLKNVTLTTKDKLQINNTLTQMKKRLDTVIDKFKQTTSTNFNSEYLEIRIIWLIYLIALHLKKQQTIQTLKWLDTGYEMYSAARKILIKITADDTLKTVSNDLAVTTRNLEKAIKFEPIILFTRFPKYTLYTKYDNITSNKSISIYPTQAELIDAIYSTQFKTKQQPLVVFHRVMIGGGKTTMAVCIAELVKKYNTMCKRDDGKKTELLFCCSSEPVRFDVMRCLWNTGVPFATGIYNNGSVTTIRNYNCPTNDDIVCTVCDEAATLHLLTQKNRNYWLFFDEPTMAITTDPAILNTVSKILLNSPEVTVLSSATLPLNHEINNVIRMYEQKYNNNICIKNIGSTSSRIGMVLHIGDEPLQLYNLCETKENTSKLITCSEQTALLRRYYTYKTYSELDKNHAPYFNSLVDTNSPTDKVSRDCIDLLKQTGIGPVKQIKKSDEFVELLTTNANKYSDGQSLIVCHDPIKLLKDGYDKLFDTEHPSFTHMQKKYKSQMEEYEKMKNDIKRNIVSANVKKASSSKDTKSDKFIGEAEQIANQYTQPHPLEQFPDSHVFVNSVAHQKWFADNEDIDEPTTFINCKTLPYEKLFDQNIPMSDTNELLIMMFCVGVAVYMPESLPHWYTTLVMDAATNNSFAFVISSDDEKNGIIFGANFPFTNVIIVDDAELSINSLYQVLGRAGRVGRSWIGKGYIGDKIMNKLKDHIINERFLSSPEGEALNRAVVYSKN